jgi:cobalt-zinc-cadmium resistance protein CzcA
MLNHIINLSLQHRFVVIALAAVLVVAGWQSARHIDIDAFPDTTPVIVQINAVAPALGPLEIEQQITFPIEQSIAGLPGLVEVRSISKFGFSQTTAMFEDGTDIYFARQLVNERLQSVELPQGVQPPSMGPVSTGLGEIYHYTVTSPDGSKSLEELTTIHDWVIKPQLRSLPGVAEVNTWGGEIRQYQVLIDPMQLLQRDLTMDDVLDALRSNNINVGGGNIVQAGELQIVQGVSLTTTLDQIGNIVITAHDGVPIRIRDVGEVQVGHEIRRGASTAGGKGEVVLGLAFMLMGENSHDVASRLDQRVNEIRRALPPGVDIRPVYQRTELVDQVIHTVKENLVIGAILVVAVLFVFLGNLRAGLLVALAIPLSMLFAANMMLATGIAASLMSLGAIDFGLVVDSSVIMVENSVRRLSLEGRTRSRLDIVRDASIEVRTPTMFGELIIMVVYLPILTLEGIEGKLFRPMALTVIFALLGSLILSLTLMPALASLLLPQPKVGGQDHRENLIIRAAQRLYTPVLHAAVRWQWTAISAAIVLLLGGALVAMRLGSEFIPRLSEGAITVNFVRLAGVSLEESVRYGTQIEKVILEKFPDEVREVWTRTGTAEIATDPMGLEVSDGFFMLRPRDHWRRAGTQQELVEHIRRELEGLPGMRVVFSQPIEMRMNEMIAGVRSDLGIKIFGDDLEVLKEKAATVQEILETVAGSQDIYVEQLTGQPMLEIVVDQDAIARYGVPAAHVLELVEAIGGIAVGEIREPQRRFDLVVRLTEPNRRDAATIANILVPTSSGERLPLGRLADIRETEGPATITREWQKRRIVVQCNVSGRDLSGFVEEVRRRIDSELDLPAAYHVSYGGQFEHLERARLRLMLIVPLALLLIVILLYVSVNSIGDALIIFTAAPFAALGGVLALWLRDMPFTISAAIGFVAVSGVSMLNGLVLVSTINQRLSRGEPLKQAIVASALMRLRPILMTALVAALGFVPMALNTGIGAEVQRPLATVVIAGVAVACIMTLVVLPAMLMILKGQRHAPPRAAE